jgi:sugar fermentation stimulation protein A
MRFPSPLIPARLIRRYKRFLADCVLEDGPESGAEITAHVANPGAMTGLAEPGARIWLRHAPDPKRKLAYSWQLAEPAPGVLVGVDTGAANRIVKPALETGAIPGLEGYTTCRSEIRYDESSRVDFLLSAEGRADAYVEVKAVTLSRSPGLAEFPDTRTARGAKHLAALARMAAAGHRAVLLYLVLRTDADRFALAADIDPVYAAAAAAARAAGVETLAVPARLSTEGIGAMADTLPISGPV